MADGIVGSVSVEVVPSTQGWSERVKAGILPGASATGEEYGHALSEAIKEGLHDPDITPHVHDEEARAEIDALKLKVDELSGKKADIDVTVNNASGVRSWLTSLVAGAVAIAPAFAVAAVGVSAFAALAVPSIAKVVAYEKDLGQNAAQAREDWKGLSDQQREMATGIAGLKSEFSGLASQIQPEVLDVFTAALSQAGLVLKEIAPLAQAGGRALETLINDIGGAFTGSGGQQFFEFVAKNLEPDVAAIGSTVASLIQTFFSLVEALQPVSLGLLHVVAAGADMLSWLSRVAPPLDDVIVLAIALYKPLQVIKGLEIAATFQNMASALTGVAAASDAEGLKFGWLSSMVSSLKEATAGSVAFAAAQKAEAAAAAAVEGEMVTFAVAADGTTVALADLTAAETASAVGMGVLEAVSPVGWLILAGTAAAALGVALYKMASTSDATTQRIIAQNNATGWNTQGYQKASAALNVYAENQIKAGDASNKVFQGSRAAILGINGYNAAADRAATTSVQFSTTAQNQAKFFGDLASKYGLSRDEAKALASQLGITSDQVNKGGKSLSQAEKQLGDFAQSMQQASAGSGALNSNMRVLAFAADQQTSAVGKLAGAWSTYITSLTGTQSSFDSYALSLGKLATDAAAAGASFGGLSKSSLTLNQDFQSQLTSLQSVSTSLRESGVSARTFDSGIKGGLDTMVQFAGHSKVATAELVAFARQAGYVGPNSLKTLRDWLGNTSGGAKKLQSAMDQATLSEAKMSDASRNLKAALESDVTNMMAQAALRTSGAQQAITQYISDLRKFGPASQQAKQDHQQLIDILVAVGMKLSAARQEADALEKQYGGTGSAAQGAGGKMHGMAGAIQGVIDKAAAGVTHLGALQRQIDSMHGKTVDIDVNVLTSGGKAPTFRPTPTGHGAGGGVLPGYAPGQDTIHTMLSPGEGVLVPEAVRAMGAGTIAAINRQYSGGRRSSPGFMAGGGIAASAQFGFPQDVFNITVNPILGSGGLGDRPVNGTPVLGNLFGLLRGELKSGSSVSAMHKDSTELANAFSNAYKDTASQIRDETKTALSDIRQYYSGPAATQLESTIRTQGSALAKLATASQNLANKIADMKAYAQQETQSLQSFSDLSTITGGTDANGNPIPVTGQQIQTSLQQDLATLRKFDSVIKQLKTRGVSKVLIAQVIALGPADGVTYGEAILAGGKTLISELNKEEKSIQSIDVKIGQHAADIQFGQPLAKSFLSELRKERDKLDNEMKHLGNTIARELEKALRNVKIKVKGSGTGAAAAGISADALGSAISVGGTVTPPHIISKSDVADLRGTLRTIAARELHLMTETTGKRLVTLLEKAPAATGKATGAALASELNGIAKNAATAARARTR